MPQDQPAIINGWSIFAHPLFLDQIENLLTHVDHLRQRDPVNFQKKNVSKLLAAIARLAFETIPQDPTNTVYRQGDALGAEYKHWFRAKFFQQYRLFFRYHAKGKIIVYAWVNDEDTKRAYGSATDAYRVFRKMLENNHPPDNWDDLVKEAKAANERFKKTSIIERNP